MAAYSYLELRHARPVANAILENTEFRQWFLNGSKYDVLGALPVKPLLQSALRSPRMKNPYWFNYWCGKDKRCACRESPSKAGIETDILLILDCANNRRLGLHIEIKPPNEKLLDGQAESYPRRAACWANPQTRSPTVLPHQDAMTVLVCGRELEGDDRLRHFDKVVFHDELAMKIGIYPEA